MSSKEWNTFTINDVAQKIFSGGTPSTTNSEYWDGEFYWLSSGETRNPFIFQTEKKITQKGVDESSTRLAQRADTVIASAGQGKTRGQISFLEVDTYINQSVIAINPNTEIVEPLWIYYNLSNRYNELRQLSDSSSIRGSLTTQVIRQMEISVPNLEVQKRIVNLLRSLDDKIELNRRTNATLEAIAQAIFKEWFIDFNFPGSNGVMEDSEFGPIPPGWKVHHLGDTPTFIIDGDRGTNYPKREDFFDNEYCLFLNAKNVTENGFDFSNCQFITKEKDERLNKGKLNRNDIVLTTRGTVGNIAYYDDFIPFDNIRINSGMVIFRLDNSIYPYFLYLFFKNKYFKDQIQFLTSGSAQPQLPIKDIRRISFILPNSAAMRSFRELMAPIEYSIGLHNQQTATLTQIRDTLLPKLMRGEIDV